MGVALWIRERTKCGDEMGHMQCNTNCDESHCTKKTAIDEFSRNASRENGSVDAGNHSMNESREAGRIPIEAQPPRSGYPTVIWLGENTNGT